MKKIIQALLMCIFVVGYSVTLCAAQLTPRKDAKKQLWGYVDENNNWVVKPKFDTAGEYTTAPNGKQRATVTSKGLTGFIDETGKPLGPGVNIESIRPVRNNLMFVTIKGKQGLMDYDGNFIVKPQFDSAEDFRETGYMVTLKGKKGLLNLGGSYLLMPQYDDITYFDTDASGKESWVVSKKGKKGLCIEGNDKPLIDFKYSGIEYSEDMNGKRYYKVFDKDGYFGLIDQSGNEVIRCVISTMRLIPRSEYVFLKTRRYLYLFDPRIEDIYGIYDYYFKEYPNGFKSIRIGANDLDKIQVKLNEKGEELEFEEGNDDGLEFVLYKAVDSDENKEHIYYTFFSADKVIANNLVDLKVRNGNWLHDMNQAFDIVKKDGISHKYLKFSDDGEYIRMEDGRYYKLEKNGKLSSTPSFDDYVEKDSFSYKKIKDKWKAYQYSNRNYKEIFECDSPYSVKTGRFYNDSWHSKYISFKLDGKCGVYVQDRNLDVYKIKLPAEYDYDSIELDYSFDEKVVLSKNGKKGTGRIDKDGGLKEIVPCVFDDVKYEIKIDKEDRIVFTKDGKKGVGYLKEDGTLKEVLPCDYDEISYYRDDDKDEAIYSRNGKTGVIYLYEDGSTKEVVPSVFDKVERLKDSYYKVSENGLFGVYDSRSKKITVPVKYKSIDKDLYKILADDGEKVESLNYDGSVYVKTPSVSTDIYAFRYDSNMNGKITQIDVGYKVDISLSKGENYTIVIDVLYNGKVLNDYKDTLFCEKDDYSWNDAIHFNVSGWGYYVRNLSSFNGRVSVYNSAGKLVSRTMAR